MMSNYFYLELDTTAPTIEIIAPSYTVRGITAEILVESSEPLMEWQDIEVIDGAGIEHKVIFKYEGDRFIGQLNFTEISVGICTIKATLKDEVGNTTETAIKTLNVLPKQDIEISYSELSRGHIIYESEFTHLIRDRGRLTGINEYANKLDVFEREKLHILNEEKQDGVM